MRIGESSRTSAKHLFMTCAAMLLTLPGLSTTQASDAHRRALRLNPGDANVTQLEAPALGPWLPPRRRIWESEHLSMAIFEAAALAMVHYGTLGPYKEA